MLSMQSCPVMALCVLLLKAGSHRGSLQNGVISILGGYRDRHGEGNLRRFLACPTANPGDKRRHGQDTCECEKTSAFPVHRKSSWQNSCHDEFVQRCNEWKRGRRI